MVLFQRRGFWWWSCVALLRCFQWASLVLEALYELNASACGNSYRVTFTSQLLLQLRRRLWHAR
jgi:hypothetical protein